MLSRRLLVGVPLAVVLIALLLVDASLWGVTPPQWLIPGTRLNVGLWLTQGALFSIITLALSALTTRELVRFARSRGHKPFSSLVQCFGAGLVLGPFLAYHTDPVLGLHQQGWGMFWLSCALGAAFLCQAAIHHTEQAMNNLASTLFILFYASGLAGFLTKLRMEVGAETGVWVVLFSMFLVKITDTGALLTGMAIGKHKLIPWLSPRKTWEGAAGGLTLAVLTAIGAGYLLDAYGAIPLPSEGVLAKPWCFVMLGLMMGVFAVAGDLAASLIKRDARVEESGAMLSGLGGVLDVFDSPLLAAPAAWFFWTQILDLSRDSI